jgi:hypothetical protein
MAAQAMKAGERLGAYELLSDEFECLDHDGLRHIAVVSAIC